METAFRFNTEWAKDLPLLEILGLSLTGLLRFEKLRFERCFTVLSGAEANLALWSETFTAGETSLGDGL